jgi:2-polyprenyl-3-methyl-5-hydroxy-6-metoxy-1,4-benzoquinol methylase
MDERAAMREAWNDRARRDAFHYVETKHWNGDVDAFFALGEERCRLLVDPLLESRGVAASDVTALDLGCGVGRITRALARRFGTVVGIDVSDEMVRRARDLHPPGAYPNLRFAESDGVSIALDDGSVDFVFSYEVLQHMPHATSFWALSPRSGACSARVASRSSTSTRRLRSRWSCAAGSSLACRRVSSAR